jgi:ubiquinone/menaquinone biosynthesis C-methylase UbiE
VKVRLRVLRWISRLYLWAAHRLYNEFAHFYDPISWLVSAGRWSQWRSIALDYVISPRVLEVGFGTGDLLAELKWRQTNVFGLDLSWAMHQLSARKLRRLGLAVPRVCGRVQALPFGDGTFDSVVSTFPAQYIVDPDALKEMGRVLRSGLDSTDRGGRVIIVGLWVYRTRAKLAASFWLQHGDPGLDRFCARLSSAGLAVSLSSRFVGATRVPVVVAERWA